MDSYDEMPEKINRVFDYAIDFLVIGSDWNNPSARAS